MEIWCTQVDVVHHLSLNRVFYLLISLVFKWSGHSVQSGVGEVGAWQLGTAGCCGWENGAVLGVENEAGGGAQKQDSSANVGSPGVLYSKGKKTEEYWAVKRANHHNVATYTQPSLK